MKSAANEYFEKHNELEFSSEILKTISGTNMQHFNIPYPVNYQEY